MPSGWPEIRSGAKILGGPGLAGLLGAGCRLVVGHRRGAKEVEVLGLEPRTIRLKVGCSNQLSYTSGRATGNKNSTVVWTVLHCNQRSYVSSSSGADRIRTCGPSCPGHRFSKPALSTTQPPLPRWTFVSAELCFIAVPLATHLHSHFLGTLDGFEPARYTAASALTRYLSQPVRFRLDDRPAFTFSELNSMQSTQWDLNPKFDFRDEHVVPEGKKVSLDKISTEFEGPFSGKEHGRAFVEEAIDEIQTLQYRMYTEAKQSLLIVLQAPDAAGKDGLIRKVLGQMNPQGCRTYPFKVPSSLERSHDFLWRIHKAAPAAGKVSIFNRSHYEDVLVVRVEDLVPKSVWKQRYEIINDFEKLLRHRGTRILKFYLHISPAEQLERFKKRLDEPTKHWKLNEGDYEARSKWGDYREAYEDAFEKCNSEHAPWYIIPADKKWYRDASVAAIVRDTFRDMDPQLPPIDADLDEIRRLYERELAKQQ